MDGKIKRFYQPFTSTEAVNLQGNVDGRIHHTAEIAPGAQIDRTAEIGAYAFVGENVTIGPGNIIEHHAIVEKNTILQNNNHIFPYAVIGSDPQDKNFTGRDTFLHIGSGNIIREFCTINRGAKSDDGRTSMGDNNYLMANTHVGHDCRLGNQIIMANHSTLAGHVEVQDHVNLSGFTAIHQYVRLGTYSFIAASAMVSQDVPPYCTAGGDRARLYGINMTGLMRHHFSKNTIKQLKIAYRSFFYSNLPLIEAREIVSNNPDLDCLEIEIMQHFVKNSQRGICGREEGCIQTN